MSTLGMEGESMFPPEASKRPTSFEPETYEYTAVLTNWRRTAYGFLNRQEFFCEAPSMAVALAKAENHADLLNGGRPDYHWQVIAISLDKGEDHAA